MAITYVTNSAVANNIASTNTPGPVSVGSGVNPTVGDMLVVSVNWTSATVGTPTVSSTLGNVPTFRGSTSNSTSHYNIAMWTMPVTVGGGADTFKATFSGNVDYPEIIVAQYHSSTGVWVYLNYAANSGNAGGTSSSGSLSFTGPGNAVFVSTNNQDNATTAGEAGWAVRISATPNFFDNILEDLIVTSTTTSAGTSTGTFVSWIQQEMLLGDTVASTPEEHSPWQPLGSGPGTPLILASDEEFAQQPIRALEELQPWTPPLPLALGMPAPVTDEELPQTPPPPGAAFEEYAPPPLLFALGPWTMPWLVDEELAQPPPPALVDEEYAPPLPPLFALTPPVLFAFDEEVAWQQVFEDYLPPLVFPAIVWAQSGAFYEQEFARAPTTVAIEEYAPGQQIAAPLVAAPPFTVFIPEQEFVQFVPPIVGSVVVDSIGVGHYIGLGHV